MSFLVLGLPRSRTAWLSKFLTYREWYCGHEELRHMRSLDDVRTWFLQPCTGSAETIAAPFWRLIDPATKLVIVRRDPGEVIESLMRLPGLSFERELLEAQIAKLDRKLGQITARFPGALSIEFEALNEESVCARVFEHCLPYAHDHEHWNALAMVNVQCNMIALMRYATAYWPALEKLAKLAKHKMLTGLAIREPVVSDGMTLQCEDFDSWVAGGQKLFEEHCALVGEAPDNWANKNIPLMRRIYDAGAMQIMTARSNGRMFGYLMTLVSPSLEEEGRLSACNTTFFASPDAPGLGLRLQRAALRALKEKGVSEVCMQDGVRGSGGRISTLYRRLGAADDGQLFRLHL